MSPFPWRRRLPRRLARPQSFPSCLRRELGACGQSCVSHTGFNGALARVLLKFRGAACYRPSSRLLANVSQAAGVVPKSDRLPETDRRPRERAPSVLKLYRPVYVLYMFTFKRGDTTAVYVNTSYRGYTVNPYTSKEALLPSLTNLWYKAQCLWSKPLKWFPDNLTSQSLLRSQTDSADKVCFSSSHFVLSGNC